MTNSEIYTQMGKRISARRKEIGLTQEKLAELMDVSIQMISNLELGKKAIRPENLIKLCQALNVSVDYILTGKLSCDEVSTISEKIKQLSVEKQLLVERLIDCLI